VWGLDLADGTELWRVDTDANVFGNPVVVDDLAVVGDATGTLWGIGLDGTTRWTAKLDGAIRGGPASDGTVIYAIGDLGEIGAFSLDGFELWRERIIFETNRGSLLAVVYASPSIVDDLLVVTFTVEGGPGSPGVVAYDRYVGGLRWWGNDPDAVAGARWANVRSSAAVTGAGLVLASSISDGVQLLDIDTGRARWAAGTGIECQRQWASPVVMGDLILLPRPDGALYGFEATGGELRWRLAMPSQLAAISECAGADGVRLVDGMDLQASVAVAPNGMVIVASTGTELYAVVER
jgi:outer membrane protein assembly factor BamB